MFFEINNKSLSPIHSNWQPGELELENYIILNNDQEESILSADIFGDQLLFISNQVRTHHRKRADILALDVAGNGVIIELKRNTGAMGVETQALQYLAAFSRYKGDNFLKQFIKDKNAPQEFVLSFMGGDAKIGDINKNSRIILIARSFDATLFSMGEWLSGKGVAFRCITYTPIEIENRKFISFSIAFDRSPESLYPLSFRSNIREPGIFWHNIGLGDDIENWWQQLLKRKEIAANFYNQPGDEGEKVLNSYITGDKIIAYAKSYGAVGWGLIENPEYTLLTPGDPGSRTDNKYRHRLRIKWKSFTKSLSQGIKPEIVREQFGIYHPMRTSVSIDSQKGIKLIEALSTKFI